MALWQQFHVATRQVYRTIRRSEMVYVKRPPRAAVACYNTARTNRLRRGYHNVRCRGMYIEQQVQVGGR